VSNWVNWVVIILGLVCVTVELALGVLTGFDLALVGASLAVGGAIGLIVGSGTIGLLAAAILALVYFSVFRRWLKAKLQVKDQPSNVDATVGRSAVVTKRIAPREAGLVKVGAEEWRAELGQTDDSTREIGAVVTVVGIEGVTLKVR